MIKLLVLFMSLTFSIEFQRTVVPEGILVLDIQGQVIIHRTKSHRIFVDTKVYTNFPANISKHLRHRWTHDVEIKKKEWTKISFKKAKGIPFYKGLELQEKFLTHVYVPEKTIIYESDYFHTAYSSK